MLLSPAAIEDVSETVKGEHFYRPAHEMIFDAIMVLHRNGEPADAVTVSSALTGSGELTRIGGPAYLHDLAGAVLTTANAGYYAKIVTNCYRLRALANEGMKLQQMSATAALSDTEDVLDEARAALDTLANDAAGVRVRTYADALEAAVDLWDRPKGRVFTTGWADLDRKFNGGWHPGQLTVLGARPAVGKSLVASCAAVAASAYGVGFFSLEMKEHEVVGRMAAASEGINLGRINAMTLNEADWQKIARHIGRVAEWPVYIEEASRITMAQVRATVRTWKRRGPLPLVIVDYMQLCTPADRKETRERQVSRIAEDCKHLAKEFDTHVLALAQVNRGSTQRADPRPTMADLRESGGIEAHADNIILLHRDDEEMEGEIELIIEKNRHGETGKIRLAWRPHLGSVDSLAYTPGQYRPNIYNIHD
jgi:replicative DNA helicase